MTEVIRSLGDSFGPLGWGLAAGLFVALLVQRSAYQDLRRQIEVGPHPTSRSVSVRGVS